MVQKKWLRSTFELLIHPCLDGQCWSSGWPMMGRLTPLMWRKSTLGGRRNCAVTSTPLFPVWIPGYGSWQLQNINGETKTTSQLIKPNLAIKASWGDSNYKKVVLFFSTIWLRSPFYSWSRLTGRPKKPKISLQSSSKVRGSEGLGGLRWWYSHLWYAYNAKSNNITSTCFLHIPTHPAVFQAVQVSRALRTLRRRTAPKQKCTKYYGKYQKKFPRDRKGNQWCPLVEGWETPSSKRCLLSS